MRLLLGQIDGTDLNETKRQWRISWYCPSNCMGKLITDINQLIRPCSTKIQESLLTDAETSRVSLDSRRVTRTSFDKMTLIALCSLRDTAFSDYTSDLLDQLPDQSH